MPKVAMLYLIIAQSTVITKYLANHHFTNRDASKVPPSQFQKRKGSIFATPGGRDGHVKGNDRDKAFHETLKQKVSC
jgi:hypothetical protein